MTGAGSVGALEGRRPAKRPILRFLLGFAIWIAAFSLLFQIAWVDEHLVLPMTEATAQVSNVLLHLFGFATQVTGTVIAGTDGIAVNILGGCNGAYVIAIFLAAVFSFPSSMREKLIGAGLGVPIVLAINLGRIVSLYYVGVRYPDLFESFHVHVWQTIVIVLAMAVWIAWAELVVKVPGR
jgi:exosortase H (IPTLxxWG-CTERM-specific)